MYLLRMRPVFWIHGLGVLGLGRELALQWDSLHVFETDFSQNKILVFNAMKNGVCSIF
jgi:hypothetical protein